MAHRRGPAASFPVMPDVSLVVLLIIAGILLAGVAIHAVAAGDPVQRTQHVLLAVLCLFAALNVLAHAALVGSEDIAAFIARRRLRVLAGSSFLLVYPWFLVHLFRRRDRIVPVLFGVIAVTMLLRAALHPGDPWMAQVEGFHHVRLPWGETLPVAHGSPSVFLAIAATGWLLLAGYGVVCALRHAGQPAAIGGRLLAGVHLVLLLGLLNDLATSVGVVRTPALTQYLLPLLTIALWWRQAMEDRRRVQSWRELFDHCGDAQLVLSADHAEVVTANQAAGTLFGREHWSGLRWVDLLIDGDGSGVGAFPVAGVRVERVRGRRADGGEFPAEATLRRSVLEGRPCLVAAVRDISERERAQAERLENERRLRTVIERCPLPIVELEVASGRVLSLNPAFTITFGFAAAGITDTAALAGRFHPDPVERASRLANWQRALAEAVRGDGVISGLQSQVHDQQGRVHQLVIRGVLVGDRGVLFISDLSDQIAARDHLARQEAWLRGIVDNAADGVCVLAVDGADEPEVRLWNPRMQALTGRSRDEVAAAGFISGLHGDAAARAIASAHLDHLRAGHELRDQEWPLAHVDGSVRTCLVSTSFLPAHDGRRLALALVHDVSELRRHEEERRHLEARVQHSQKLESLGVLAGGIAHDFNNILMTVLGRADLLVRGDRLDAAGRAEVIEIRTAAERAADLCRQLLAYAGKGRLTMVAVDCSQVVREMAELLTVSISKKAHLVYDLATVPAVQADPGQLRQVVMNLITNAAEAIGDGPGTITVRTGTMACTPDWLAGTPGGAGRIADRAGGGTARTSLPRPDALGAAVDPPAPVEGVFLEVVDTGCGMDQATQERIFEPFFTTKFTGRGLGMSAVRGIVEGHGGALRIDSRPGQGTSIRVALPAITAVVITPLPSTATAFTGGLVLIVDDEPLVRIIATEMLGGLGFTSLAVTTGAEAIAVFTARHGTIAFVILDLTLPDLDGDAIFSRLRAIAPALPVIIASGYSRDEVMQRFVGIPGVAILQKPYGLDALTDAIGSIVASPTA